MFQTNRTTRTYVLDTSVLLADPSAITRFEEHGVVLPVVVVTELEAKRDHPELGYFARAALRRLDELRVEHGRLDRPVPVGDVGGTLRVELNHTDASSLPSGFRLGDNDTRILAVARNLADEGHTVTLVSKDLPLRIKASAVGLDAQEYRAELAPESGWTGMVELEVESADLDDLYDGGRVELEEARELPCHTGLVLLSGDAGVGKTRLLVELRDRAVLAGWQVFAGHCLDFGDSALPYLPFSEVLGRLATALPEVVDRVATSFPALSRLQPGRRMMGARSEETGALDRADLFEAVHTLLEAAAESAPLLLVIEDTHWADQSTRDMLSFLFSRPFAGPVALVASYRSDDLHRRHPLRRQVAEWSRLRGVHRGADVAL